MFSPTKTHLSFAKKTGPPRFVLPDRRAKVFAVLALLALALSACSPEKPASFQGYIEGEYLYLSAPQAGYLKTLDSARGQRVTAGQTLFTLASDPDAQALDAAEAQVSAAHEKISNLQEPRREPEIAALEANLQAAQASQRLAKIRLQQQEVLAQAKFVSKIALDEARSAFEQANAQVEAARQQRTSYQNTLGRPAEVRGAQADLQAATALVAQKRWALERKTVNAPVAGAIFETFYRPGEWIPAGAAVTSLLPDDRRRIRFFVPETTLALLRPGQGVEASCDACAAPIRGTIDFISPHAEYTPPVIYSRDSRAKLVFRVEAAPAPEQAINLRPGLPVDVRLMEH